MTTTLQPRKINFGTSGQKYRNRPVVLDGRRFPSIKEAKRYQDLKFLQSQDRIRNLRLQVTYDFVVAGIKVCSYRADFVYEERVGSEWLSVVEDVKGWPTKEYRIKRKLMKACHGIDIKET